MISNQYRTIQEGEYTIPSWYCHTCEHLYKSQSEVKDCFRNHDVMDVFRTHEKKARDVLYSLGDLMFLDVIKSKTNTSEIIVKIEIGNKSCWVDIQSATFQNKLRNVTRENCDELPSDDAYKSAIKTLYAQYSLDSNVRKQFVYRRCAYENDKIYYDTGNEIIVISKEGVRKVTENDDNVPVFLTIVNGSFIEQPNFTPYDNDDPLEEFTKLIRIPEEDKVVFKGHFISEFIQGIDSPIMLFNGEQNSAKSTTANSVKDMIDPESENGTSMQKNLDDMAVILHNKYITHFDNLSFISHEQSDFLCRITTGTTYEKRSLFTNSDPHQIHLHKKIILNGIEPQMDRPDLLDRVIQYELGYVKKEENKSKEELREIIDEIKPRLLGQIFDTISKAITIRKQVRDELKGKKLPRMADFSIWAESISRVLGYEPNYFIDRYLIKIQDIKISLASKYPVVGLIQDFMSESVANPRTIQLNDLHEIIKNQYDGLGERYDTFPKTPDFFSKQLKRMSQTFREVGIEITSKRYLSRDNQFKRGSTLVTIMNNLKDRSE